MKKWIAAIIFLVLLMVGSWYGWEWYRARLDPKGAVKNLPVLNLGEYDFDNLRLRQGKAGNFEILGNIKPVEDRRTQKQDFTTKEIRFQSDGKWISGMINYYPEKSSLSPVIIMVRGYAEKVGYYPGSGTWRVADELAKEGYSTISLDFLGYADSDMESADVMEARFNKVIELMDLIESVKQLPWVDKNRIGIWAHSNGGQIVLSTLEITGQRYPTVLWAPMTNPFPQSLIDTADEGEARQEATKFVNVFLKNYDGRRYAFENYYEWLKAPVLIQQGTKDVWCKVEWQQTVVNGINNAGGSANLVVYDGADHNMAGPPAGGWKEAVKKDLEYYNLMISL